MSITPPTARGSAFDPSQWAIQAPDDLESYNNPKSGLGHPDRHIVYTRGSLRYIRAPLNAPPTQDTRVPAHWDNDVLQRELTKRDRYYAAAQQAKTAWPIAIGDIVDVFFGDGAPLMHENAEVISEPGAAMHLRMADHTVHFISGGFQLVRKPRTPHPPKDTTA